MSKIICYSTKFTSYVLITAFLIVVLLSCQSETRDVEIKNKADLIDIEAEDSVFSELTHFYNVCPDSAILMASEYEDELLKISDYRALTRLYSFLSELYQYRVKDDFKALSYISRAMDVLAEHPDTFFDNPFLFINAGNILYSYGMYSEAIYVYREIENVMDVNKRPEVRTLICNNLGLAFQSLNECDSARYYYNKALKMIVPTDSRSGLMEVQCYNYLSSISLQCEERDSVVYFYRKSIPLFQSIDSLQTESVELWNDIRLEYISSKLSSIANMGRYKRFNNDYLSALDYFFEALSYAEEFDDVSWKINLRSEIAATYVFMNEYENAYIFVNQAIEELPYGMHEFQSLSYIFQLKADILKKLNRENEYLHYLRISEEYSDSLTMMLESKEFSSKRIELAVKPIQFSMKKIEFKKNQLLKTVKMKLKIAEQKKEIAMYRWLAITGCMFFALLGSIFLLYRNKSKKKLAELLLENMEKEKKFMTSELQCFSMHLVYRNDFLRQIQASLKDLVRHASDQNMSRIKDLNVQINQNLQSSHDSNMIDEKIHEINSGFLFSLSEKYPKLTENDKNLCALVRMNLTSKEIASIKNISERSVITARYRLRQKLELTTDQNLSDFLKQL